MTFEKLKSSKGAKLATLLHLEPSANPVRTLGNEIGTFFTLAIVHLSEYILH